MDAVALTIGLCWIGTSVTIGAMAMPLIRGRVPRNGLYGVRLPQSFKSDAAWIAINRYGGRQLLWAAITSGVCGLLTLPWRLEPHPAAAVFVGLSPLVFHVVALWMMIRFAAKYDQKMTPATPE